MYLHKKIKMDLEDIHQIHSVLEAGVEYWSDSQRRLWFYCWTKNKIFCFICDLQTFYRESPHILLVYFKKFIHVDSIRILETNRSKYQVCMLRVWVIFIFFLLKKIPSPHRPPKNLISHCVWKNFWLAINLVREY